MLTFIAFPAVARLKEGTVDKAADAAFKLSLDELEGVDELSVRVFRAFLNAMRLHRQLMIAALAERDTHPGQAICLRFLSANEGITQRDLADALHLARPTVSKMLQAMERAGAIERRSDEHDQRLTRVHLSAAGHELETELRAVSAASINETIGALSERDRREFERLLGALSASISAAIAARRAERAEQSADDRESTAHAADEHERAAQTVGGNEPAVRPSRARAATRPSA
jgi:DNA-binding MarR family transcriptional regulator